MSNLGLPVPPGFTITSGACLAYMEAHVLPEGLMEAVAGHVESLEEALERLKDRSRP
jgi:pyruvate, orthophosphate dikinase